MWVLIENWLRSPLEIRLIQLLILIEIVGGSSKRDEQNVDTWSTKLTTDSGRRPFKEDDYLKYHTPLLRPSIYYCCIPVFIWWEKGVLLC